MSVENSLLLNSFKNCRYICMYIVQYIQYSKFFCILYRKRSTLFVDVILTVHLPPNVSKELKKRQASPYTKREERLRERGQRKGTYRLVAEVPRHGPLVIYSIYGTNKSQSDELDSYILKLIGNFVVSLFLALLVLLHSNLMFLLFGSPAS